MRRTVGSTPPDQRLGVREGTAARRVPAPPLPWLWVAHVQVALPAAALVLCIGLSVTRNYSGVTKTHCNVPNSVPSLSASIGDFTPQRYIWRFMLSMNFFPRVVQAFLNRVAYGHRLVGRRFLSTGWLGLGSSAKIGPGVAPNDLALALAVAEQLCLLLLSLVSSSESPAWIHTSAFIGFLIFSIAQMAMLVHVNSVLSRRVGGAQAREDRARYETLRAILVATCVMLPLAAYFYWRHNAYCEAQVYSCFACCEWAAVALNIAFNRVALGPSVGKGVVLMVALVEDSGAAGAAAAAAAGMAAPAEGFAATSTCAPIGLDRL